MRRDGEQLRCTLENRGGTATSQGGGSCQAPGETLFQVAAPRIASLPNASGGAARALGGHWRTMSHSTFSITLIAKSTPRVTRQFLARAARGRR